MNWIDGVIIGIFIFYLVEGVRRGFIEQCLELLGFFFSLLFTFLSYRPVAEWLADSAGLQAFAAKPVAFLGLWIFFQIIYSFILQLTYPKVPALLRQAKPNRLAGVIPAFVKGYIFISVLLTLFLALTIPAKLKTTIDQSLIGSRFVAQSGNVQQYLSRLLGQDIKDTLTFLTVPPQSEEIVQPDERVMLKFTVNDGVIDKQAEQEMLQRLNDERVKAGLKPLVWNEKAAVVARMHSKDMFARGYFSHEDLEGRSPFDRMNAGGVTFTAAGENLAYAATVELAHNGLMRSPGHRANILETDYGTVGIGVIDGGIYGKMFTQVFTN